MPSPVIVVGMGELGGVFARGLLRAGHPVFPVTRRVTLSVRAEEGLDPELVLITVGEADLAPVLEDAPAQYRGRLGLVQNELLPRDWLAHGLATPTVAVVWFEKKPGRPVNVVLPTVLHGPGAALLEEGLGKLDIPTRRATDEDALLTALVEKNLYILTTNLAGLRSGGTAQQLWRDHRALAEDVAGEVLDIQDFLTERKLSREPLMQAFERAVMADPAHQCTGRSAPIRLARAIGHADRAGLAVPTLRAIAREQTG